MDIQPNGACALATVKAIDRLRQGKPDDSLSRDQMAEVIGISCGPGTRGYANVRTAIYQVERNHHIVWRWRRHRQAWVYLSSQDAVEEERRHLLRGHKETKRSVVVSLSVDASQLNDEMKRDHQINQAQAGMAHLCTGLAFKKRLAATPEIGKLREPDVVGLIEFMRPK